MPKNVLTLKTVQIAPFRTLMTALKDILLETNITFQNDGIRIINMDLLNLSIRIFSDTIPKEFNTYCFAHNIETLDSIINTLAENNINETLILENKIEMSGVSEFNKTNNKFTSRGIKTNKIKFDDSMINTKNESEYVIRWCHQNNIKNLLLVSPVFHTLRSTMTFISTMLDLNVNLNIFILPSK